MRVMFLVTTAALGLAFPAIAQQQEPDMELPEIVIGGEKPTAPDSNCADVDPKGSGKGDYHCLNQNLQREVDQNVPTLNLPPIDAQSSDISRGVVNIPALKQQYGPNYGVSVIPYRPAPPPPSHGPH